MNEEEQEVGRWPEDHARRVAARKARFHRRHRRARWHEWAGALSLVVLAAWLTVLIAAFVVAR